MSYLKPQQVESFHADGFLVVPRYFGEPVIATLRAKAAQIVQNFDMAQISIFSSVDQTKTTDDYFISSGDKVRCFFEEESFDEHGNLIKEKLYAVNKIGHALHDLDKAFEAASYKPELADIAAAIGMNDPLMVQSQYIFKQPGIGGKVVAHQDSTYIYTDPPSCIGFWVALEDASTHNGCLWAIPGSHKKLSPSRRFVRTDDANGVGFIGDKDEWDLERMVPLEVERGTLVILHGSAVHMSRENRSDTSRHAYIIHMVDGGRPWPADNWLQRPPATPFRGLNEVVKK